jgi:hypothetical protein
MHLRVLLSRKITVLLYSPAFELTRYYNLSKAFYAYSLGSHAMALS